MASPSPPAAGRRKHTIYHGHRRPSPHRPTVRGGLFTDLRSPSPSPTPRASPSPTTSATPFRLADWDPHPSSSSSSVASPSSPSASASARRLSPLARFLLDALRRHQRWGPPVVADLTQAPPRAALTRRRGPHRAPAPSAAARAPVLPLGRSPEGLPPLLPGVPRPRLASLRRGAPRRRRPAPGPHARPREARLHPAAHAPRPPPHRRAPSAPRSPCPPPLRHKFDVKPEVHACNRVLGALAAAGHVEDALKLFDEMAETETRPMPVTFAIMVRALLEMIERMRNEVCRPDVFVYTALVKTMVRRGHMDGCIRVWKEMEKDGVAPDAMAYATIVGGLCKAGMVEEAAELFKEMRKKGLLVDRDGVHVAY
ncbi:hypothetical protein HU200_002023 [Digitaria exilis]|uniref:Pentatricopeptide repeat-containing protein n=1 Tax=Digitaria exilis TaxID=1010633 RepID=A0A835FXG1_9POAL|nr:hypothetical protein HU200_002023 [Digitaria exilis]